MTYHVAQYNVGRVRRSLDEPEMAEFVAALDPINAIAEGSPGFVWRLTDDEGGPSSFLTVDGIDDPLVIVNYSIWEDLDSLRHFVYRSGHSAYLRRRREWFQRAEEPNLVCWWVPAGEIPSVEEAQDRLLRLRAEGASEAGWPLSDPFPAPS